MSGSTSESKELKSITPMSIFKPELKEDQLLYFTKGNFHTIPSTSAVIVTKEAYEECLESLHFRAQHLVDSSAREENMTLTETFRSKLIKCSLDEHLGYLKSFFNAFLENNVTISSSYCEDILFNDLLLTIATTTLRYTKEERKRIQTNLLLLTKDLSLNKPEKLLHLYIYLDHLSGSFSLPVEEDKKSQDRWINPGIEHKDIARKEASFEHRILEKIKTLQTIAPLSSVFAADLLLTTPTSTPSSGTSKLKA
jgi:hypothetical protein